MVVGGLLVDAELTARLPVIEDPLPWLHFLRKLRYNSLPEMKCPSLCLEAGAAV
jgi:hypothetical protein